MGRNLPLWLNTRLVELVKEGERVVGAIVEREGKRMAIRAERGVVLAAGGFEKNQAMREKYLPKPTDAKWSAGVFTNTGDAIVAGAAVVTPEGAAYKVGVVTAEGAAVEAGVITDEGAEVVDVVALPDNAPAAEAPAADTPAADTPAADTPAGEKPAEGEAKA